MVRGGGFREGSTYYSSIGIGGDRPHLSHSRYSTRQRGRKDNGWWDQPAYGFIPYSHLRPRSYRYTVYAGRTPTRRELASDAARDASEFLIPWGRIGRGASRATRGFRHSRRVRGISRVPIQAAGHYDDAGRLVNRYGEPIQRWGVRSSTARGRERMIIDNAPPVTNARFRGRMPSSPRWYHRYRYGRRGRWRNHGYNRGTGRYGEFTRRDIMRVQRGYGYDGDIYADLDRWYP